MNLWKICNPTFIALALDFGISVELSTSPLVLMATKWWSRHTCGALGKATDEMGKVTLEPVEVPYFTVSRALIDA